MYIPSSMLNVPTIFLCLSLAIGATELPDGRTHANLPPAPLMPSPDFSASRIAGGGQPVLSRNLTELPPYNTPYWFDQLVDHGNPSRGTFKQRCVSENNVWS